MALNSSGPLSIGGSTTGQSINLEFGRTATQQTGMSQLYRGGGIVPNATPNNGIPTSGAIAIGNFYGATNRVPVSLTISSATQNYNIYNNRPGGYSAGITDLTLTVNVVVGSSSTGAFGMTIGGFAAGDTVTIVNNSYIVGRGGQGGAGGGANAGGNPGGAGGPALNADFAVTIYNYGVIGGGGGGGGGSGGAQWWDGGYGYGGLNGQGGGGGAGNTAGTSNSNGGAGTLTTGGGGAGAYSTGYLSYGRIGSGGAGGSQGAAGGAGNTSSYAAGTGGQAYYGGGAGGGAGACTSGNVRITWAVAGTRNGALN